MCSARAQRNPEPCGDAPGGVARTAKGDLPSHTTLEQPVQLTRSSHWAMLKIDGESYKAFGEITAGA